MQELIDIVELRLKDDDLINSKIKIEGLVIPIETYDNINFNAIDDVFNFIAKALSRVKTDQKHKYFESIRNLIKSYFSNKCELLKSRELKYQFVRAEIELYLIVEAKLLHKITDLQKSLINGIKPAASKGKVLKYSKEQRRLFYLDISKKIGLFEEPQMAVHFAEFMSDPRGTHPKYSLHLRCSNRDFNFVLTTIHNKIEEFKFEKKNFFHQLLVFGKNGKFLNQKQFQNGLKEPKYANELLSIIESCLEQLKKD